MAELSFVLRERKNYVKLEKFSYLGSDNNTSSDVQHDKRKESQIVYFFFHLL